MVKIIYKVKNPRAGDPDHKVIHIPTGKPVFYGKRSECNEWIEHNGHLDDSEV